VNAKTKSATKTKAATKVPPPKAPTEVGAATRKAITDAVDAFRSRAAEVKWKYATRPPATPAQIAALEKAWGRPLPPSYRALLEISNGIESYGAMRLLGTEDQAWGREQIEGLVEHWEIPAFDDDEPSDYDPDTFATQYLPVLVAEAGMGIHNFYTFERTDAPEWKVVGWEYGSKEKAQSLVELLELEGDLPESDPTSEPARAPAPPDEEVTTEQALDALASGRLSAEGDLRDEAMSLLFEPGYFVDRAVPSLATAVATVIASDPTDEEKQEWYARMPSNVEHVRLFVELQAPDGDDAGWYRKVQQYLFHFGDHGDAPRWADAVRPHAAKSEHLAWALARIYARAGRVDDAIAMCEACAAAGPGQLGLVFADEILAGLRPHERFKAVFRQPAGSKPLASYFGPYEVTIEASLSLPPLLDRFLGWLRLQPQYTLGWFTKAEVRAFAGGKGKPAFASELVQLVAFHPGDEIAVVEHQSVLALHGRGDAARVVLVHGAECWEIAPSVETFLRRWATSTTGVSALDQDGRRTIRFKKTDSTPSVSSRRALIGLWLDDQGVAPSPAGDPAYVGDAGALPKGIVARPRALPALPEDEALLRKAAADPWTWDDEHRREVNAGKAMKAYGEWLQKQGHAIGALVLADFAAEREPRKERKAKTVAKQLFGEHVASSFAGPLAAIVHEMTHFLEDKYYFSFRYGFLEKLDIWECGPRMLAHALELLRSPYGRLVRKVCLRRTALPLTELARLPALRNLEMVSSREVEELAPLAELTHLSRLALGPTSLSDLSPLARLPLETATLGPGAAPFDLTPLARIPTLRELDLAGTPIASAAPLLESPTLQKVSLWGTKVSLEELKPLKALLAKRGGRLSHHHPDV